MKKNLVGVVVLLMMVFGVWHGLKNSPHHAYTGARDFLASIFFVDSITETQLQDTFAKAQQGVDQIRILVVPGHDDDAGGTHFRDLREADLNVMVATELYELLKKDAEFDVFLARDEQGYAEDLERYFVEEEANISNFRNTHRNIMEAYVEHGYVETVHQVDHVTVVSDTMIKLYGINKWANENEIDVVLHIHFNDYPGHGHDVVGKYTGFSIYIPEKQYSNAKASRPIAEKIRDRLDNFFTVSDMPKETEGVIEDQELIAVGAFNTLEAVSVLIEYAYIYESQVSNPQLRPITTKELATQTYWGIRDYFEKEDNQKNMTTILPHVWTENIGRTTKYHPDVLALQVALISEGLYPPKNATGNDCPLSGYFGTCTERAVVEFQKKYDIAPAEGYVGPLTREKLNELFSDR
jgi:N-acetylmuramoyl-L-alanine amidase